MRWYIVVIVFAIGSLASRAQPTMVKDGSEKHGHLIESYINVSGITLQRYGYKQGELNQVKIEELGKKLIDDYATSQRRYIICASRESGKQTY